jgi:hypothetical protein
MAIVRRRDVEEHMPPEVRQRVRKGGVPEGKVAWYAGREYVSNLKVNRGLETPPELEDEMRDTRRRMQPSAAKRAQTLSLAVAHRLHGLVPKRFFAK